MLNLCKRSPAPTGLSTFDMAALLQLPVAANPDGWGPVSMPEAFKDLPYVPFGKGDKLGKVADWGAYTRQGRYRCECSVSKFAAQPASVHGVHPPRAASRHREENTDFQYTVDRKEEKTFKQVDYGSGRSECRGRVDVAGLPRAAFEQARCVRTDRGLFPARSVAWQAMLRRCNTHPLLPQALAPRQVAEGAAGGASLAEVVAEAVAVVGASALAPWGTWAAAAAVHTRTWLHANSASCWPPTTTSAFLA